MFKSIADRINYAPWVRYDPRYRSLDIFDRLLDGTFYDDIPNAFYDEKQAGNNDPIPLRNRRPSAQYHLPRMVARSCARKLFAGRHVPRIVHPDKVTMKNIKKIAKRAKLFETMLEVATLGSVGSVAVTFRVDKEDNRIAFTVWRAKYCQPSFNDVGELDNLRVAYGTLGSQMLSMGFGHDVLGRVIDPTEKYWFIRDYTTQHEITYIPIQRDEWNPVEGSKREGVFLSPSPEDLVEHGLGFVPGHWFKNLSGGCAPDGACTWEDAISNSIEIDYTMSQIGRGVRYNCSPQPVIKGDIINEENSVTRDPTHYIHLAGDRKDAEGNVLGGGTAMLLEMNGSGIKASLDYVQKLHDNALEQIAASRKDPEKMKGTLSGRAMEFLEEDSNDLAMELRSSYGEHGLLPLLKKLIHIVAPDIDIEKLGLKWPRMYQPTPQDISYLIPALAIAIDPLGVGKVKPGATAEGAAPQAPVEPDTKFMILTPEEARSYMRMQMDLDMLDDEENESEDDIDDHKSPVDAKKDHPEPLPVGEQNDKPEPGILGMTIGAPVTVNA